MNPTLEAKLILQPVFAQALLTMLVWCWVLYTRLSTMSRKRISPQSLVYDAENAYAKLKDVEHPSENLENLFELPVLFFVAALVLYLTNRVDSLFLTLSWAFVIFRVAHSLIHCTFNRVTYRFAVYLISSLALWWIWIRIGLFVFE